jgi:hypothetical protein
MGSERCDAILLSLCVDPRVRWCGGGALPASNPFVFVVQVRRQVGCTCGSSHGLLRVTAVRRKLPC